MARGNPAFRVSGGSRQAGPEARGERGWVKGLDQARFEQAARDGCPISQALEGNVALGVRATLVG